MAELQEYIEDVLSQIEKGKGKHEIWGSVHFDIAATKKVEGGGKIVVSVLGAEGSKKSESISRIQFRIQMQNATGDANAFTK